MAHDAPNLVTQMTHAERIEAVAEVLEAQADNMHRDIVTASILQVRAAELRAIAAEMRQPTSVLCTKCGYSASVLPAQHDQDLEAIGALKGQS